MAEHKRGKPAETPLWVPSEDRILIYGNIFIPQVTLVRHSKVAWPPPCFTLDFSAVRKMIEPQNMSLRALFTAQLTPKRQLVKRLFGR